MPAPIANRSVAEAGALRPRLRDGLRITMPGEGTERTCLIEDPHTSRFHRVGLHEYRFIAELDGTQTVASILARLARQGAGESFTESEALQILQWLAGNHLLTIDSAHALATDHETARVLLGASAWLNPLIVKVPLARPDRFFAAAARHLRWLLGPAGFAIWLLVVAGGASQVALDWRRFTAGFDGFFAREQWLWLLIVWTALKLVHEFAHGVFCRHFGAAVREIGAIFVLFVPMGYVDATASLGIASRWRRIMVACAGMYAECFVAGLAAIFWAQTPVGLLSATLHAVIVTGTAVTFFFNANPLMRFDGYFILGDFLGVVNLAPRGRQWLRSALAWLILGAKSSRPAPPRTREDWLVALYGAAAGGWQIVILAGLLTGASAMLRGGGLLLATMAGVLWFGIPITRAALATWRSVRTEAGRWWSIALRVTALMALVAAVFVFPFRRSVSGTGVVELADSLVLRAECPGFVEKAHVRDGDVVTAGQLLVELRNDDATAALARSRIELAAQELRARLAFTRESVSAAQAEQARAEALRATVAQHDSYVATLQIRAPFAGRITARALDRLHGAFFRAGEEIAHLGRADGCDVRIALDQEAEPHFRTAIAKPLQVRVEGVSGTWPATLTRVESRATRELIDPALTVLAGGPLALRRIEEEAPSAAEIHPASPEAPGYELAQPHFVALARVPTAQPLFTGQLARVKLRSSRPVNLWQLTQSGVHRWMRRITAQS